MDWLQKMTRKVQRIVRRIRQQECPVQFLAGYMLQKLRISGLIVFQRKHYRLRLYPHSSMAHHLWANPSSRDHEDRLLELYLREGDVFVDIGANIGTFALTAASLLGASGQVFAIEAHPQTCSYLEQNIALNGFQSIHTFNCALGSSDGWITFANSGQDDTRRMGTSQGVRVALRKLDTLLADYAVTAVDFIKLDVEGAEKEVCVGAARTLPQTACIYCEVLAENLAQFGTTPAELFDVFEQQGFELYRTSEKSHDVLAIRDSAAFRQRVGADFNLIAVHRAK